MIYNYVQSIYVLFNDTPDRSQQFLDSYVLTDQKLRDLTDLSHDYIRDSFEYINNLVTENIIAYFN